MPRAFRFSAGRAAQLVFGTVVGISLVWLLFRGTDRKALLEAFATVDLRFVLLSQAAAWTSHFLRVQRWTHIIRAHRAVPYRTVFAAAQIGFLLNVSLPLRLGDGMRGVLLSRTAGLRLSSSLALVGLDRAADFAALVVVAGVGLVSFPTERDVTLPAGALGTSEPLTVPGSVLAPLTAVAALACIGILLLLGLLYARGTAVLDGLDGRLTRLPTVARERIHDACAGFVAGMEVLGSAGAAARAFAFSLAAWSAAVVSLGLLLHAFSLGAPWYVPVAMQAMIALAVGLPLAPGLIGQFHLAVLVCLLLTLPGLGLARAQAVAIAAHFLSLLPVVALGTYALLRLRGGRAEPVSGSTNGV